MGLKAVILVGGAQKGTRFRPLSLDVPKPLFPIAGYPTILHHIERLTTIPGLTEILVIGFYQSTEHLSKFCVETQKQFDITIRYLQEYAPLGTAGGIYHFRDQILLGQPESFFVLNADVCGDLPLKEMLEFHKAKGNHFTMLTTEAARDQSLNYGCAVVNKTTSKIMHYVEKPSTFVSAFINCGVYLFNVEIFQELKLVFQTKAQMSSYNNGDSGESAECIYFESDIFPKLASSAVMFFAFYSTNWWSQIKSAASAIYANGHYLELFSKTHPERLAKQSDKTCTIHGNVFIHPTAKVDRTAVIGPNVAIGKDVVIGAGVRVRDSIVLDGAQLHEHSCILHSIIGWHTDVGMWARVEGTPIGPNPNIPFAKLESKPLFKPDGRLNPSITILGSHVQIPPEVIILNSIVLPHKELGGSFKNQIIL